MWCLRGSFKNSISPFEKGGQRGICSPGRLEIPPDPPLLKGGGPWQGDGEGRNSPAAEERELLVESLGQHTRFGGGGR